MAPVIDPPAHAVKLVNDLVDAGWPATWLDAQVLEGIGYEVFTVGIVDHSTNDRYRASWSRSERSGWRWRFMHADDGWQEMSLKALRSCVRNGPVEVTP